MDLDETMTTSTTSSPSDDENLFPEHRSSQQAHTPANDHLNAAAPGELSPPRSQPNSDEAVPQTIANGAGQQANMSATRSAAKVPVGDNAFPSNAQGEEASQPATAGEREERPGWGWKNKKAQEEMQRAWDNVVDRDFSLKEYGDVILLGKAALGQK